MTETHAESGGSVRTRRWVLFAGLALAVVITDQLSKAFVDADFRPAWTRGPTPGYDAPTPVLGDNVRIAKSYNEGGIFGLFGEAAPILAIASLAVIAFIVYYQARHGWRSRLLTVALGLLLGGALGNFIDRVRFGYVIDFVDMGVGDLRWYTFNVADASISTAIVALVTIGLLGDRSGRRSSESPEEDRGGVTAATPTPEPGGRVSR